VVPRKNLSEISVAINSRLNSRLISWMKFPQILWVGPANDETHFFGVFVDD